MNIHLLRAIYAVLNICKIGIICFIILWIIYSPISFKEHKKKLLLLKKINNEILYLENKYNKIIKKNLYWDNMKEISLMQSKNILDMYDQNEILIYG